MIPVFSNRGVPTDEGRAVLNYIESTIKAAGKNATRLNAMPGVVKHFYANVVQIKSMSEAEWLEDYRMSYANSAWAAVESIRAQEAQQAQADGAQTKLTENLEELAAKLEAALARIADLEKAKKPDEESKDKPDAEAAPTEA